MNQRDLLARLKERSACFSLAGVRTFKGYRHDKGNPMVVREVTIEIFDAGPGAPDRYWVVAMDDEGRAASGHPGDQLELVLATTDWGSLTADPMALPPGSPQRDLSVAGG